MESVRAVGQPHEAVVILQVTQESLRKTSIAVIRAGYRAGQRRDGVGVVPGVDGAEEDLLEILGAGQKAPESAREGTQDVRTVVPRGEGCFA